MITSLIQANQNITTYGAGLQYCISGDVSRLLDHFEKQLSLLNKKLDRLDDNQDRTRYCFGRDKIPLMRALLIHIPLWKLLYYSETNLLEGS